MRLSDDHAHILTTTRRRQYRYDPVAFLCALPSKRYLFNPTIKCVYGVRHLVVGTSPENSGVRAEAVEELRDLMYANFFRGVTLDYSEFTKTRAVVNESDELGRRRLAESERSVVRKRTGGHDGRGDGQG